MNKIMMFPMLFMFLLTAYAVVASGETYESVTDDWSETGEITHNTTVGDDTGFVIIPEGDSGLINVWFTGAVLALLLIAIAVAIIAGMKVLGTGLNAFSQTTLFNSILFLGLWTGLTVVSASFFFDTPILTMVWISLTTMYAVGLGVHITGSSAAGG